jgi:hypothetical protein
MKPIQLILLSLLATILGCYFARLRSLLLDRAIVLFLAAVGVIMIVAPRVTMRAARLVGVGRGVDLVIYLSLFSLAFLWTLLFSRQRSLETRLTDLTRAVALDNARQPESSNDTPNSTSLRKAG